eukprot:3887679-Rhodomonas_salina.3
MLGSDDAFGVRCSALTQNMVLQNLHVDAKSVGRAEGGGVRQHCHVLHARCRSALRESDAQLLAYLIHGVRSAELLM